MNEKANTFDATLREMHRGRTVTELSEKLAELLAAARVTGNGGYITYKLVVKPINRGDVMTLELADDITVKMPQTARGKSIFFCDENNVLSRRDPRQDELRLAEKPVQAAAVPEPGAARA